MTHAGRKQGARVVSVLRVDCCQSRLMLVNVPGCQVRTAAVIDFSWQTNMAKVPILERKGIPAPEDCTERCEAGISMVAFVETQRAKDGMLHG
jgi:hypothetical protein